MPLYLSMSAMGGNSSRSIGLLRVAFNKTSDLGKKNLLSFHS